MTNIMHQMTNITQRPWYEAVIFSAPYKPSSKNFEKWVLAATIIGSSMAMMDVTVVNVALPILQTVLDGTTTEMQWVVESYSLFLSALILVGGSLSDRFGRRRIYTAGVVLFALASAWCGLSSTVNQLIIARAVQGIGGALLVPGSLAIISAVFEGEKRSKAIGTWAGFTAITSALGTVLGGWLVEECSWRWIFFLNLPLAVMVLGISLLYMPESFGEDSPKLDCWGTLLATLGLGTLVYGLIESCNLTLTHPLVITCLVLGALIMCAFVLVEAKTISPMMPLSLFKSKTFSGANLLTLLLYSALGGVFYLVPFDLIQIQHYSATAAGAAFLPYILIMFFLSEWSGSLLCRYGARLPLTLGPLLTAVGFALFIVPGVGGSYWTTFFPAITVLGLGMTINAAPLTTTVMSAVKQRQAGIASGINNAISRTAGLLAIAVFNIFLFNAFNYNLDRYLAKLNIPLSVIEQLSEQRFKLAGAEIPANVTGELRRTLQEAITFSFVDGFRLVMLIAAILAFASAVVAFFTIKNRPEVSEEPSSDASKQQYIVLTHH